MTNHADEMNLRLAEIATEWAKTGALEASDHLCAILPSLGKMLTVEESGA
jgi:hypothetical protein